MATAAMAHECGVGQGGQAGADVGAGAAAFAQFLASTGNRVLRGAGTYWYDRLAHLVLSTPRDAVLVPWRDAPLHLGTTRPERRAALRFLKNGRGELFVHLAIYIPVSRIEGRPAEDLMA